jgi:hypothetical protein
MKNALVAILLVFGVSVWGSAFACDGKDKEMSSGASVPSSPAPTPVTSK